MEEQDVYCAQSVNLKIISRKLFKLARLGIYGPLAKRGITWNETNDKAKKFYVHNSQFMIIQLCIPEW